MQLLCYGLIVISGLLGIAVAIFGCLLGWMLCSSYVNSDQLWGLGIILFSLAYFIHPTFTYWLTKNTYFITAILMSLLMIASSIILLFILPSAIEAAARP